VSTCGIFKKGKLHDKVVYYGLAITFFPKEERISVHRHELVHACIGVIKHNDEFRKWFKKFDIFRKNKTAKKTSITKKFDKECMEDYYILQIKI